MEEMAARFDFPDCFDYPGSKIKHGRLDEFGRDEKSSN
jgi:hypothetical protein